VSQKTLWAGPWVGEFGWELFCWHGFLRKLARKFDRVMIACRTGHDLLYADFATDIVHYDPDIEETDMWMNRSCPDLRNFHSYYTKESENLKVVPIDTYRAVWWPAEKFDVRQTLVSYGMQDDGVGFDVLIVVRDTQKCRTGFRNWPAAHAEEFVSRMRGLGFTVACVGKSKSALWVPGATDYRNLPLTKLAQLMANSRVIVGPQCGPIHFGTLCLLPQVCWQTKPAHAVRTQTHWNPHGVPVMTMPSDGSYWRKHQMWTPPVQHVVDDTIKILSRGVER